MNECGTHHFRLQESGVRHELRQPPLWMMMNLWKFRCWCGEKIVWPRRKYCCEDHARLWFYQIRCYWDGFRYQVIRQDNYICQECGFKKEGETEAFQVDHIVAISLGGDCFERENVRTLCIECHKIKTKEDMGKLSMKRKKLQPLEVFGFGS